MIEPNAVHEGGAALVMKLAGPVAGDSKLGLPIVKAVVVLREGQVPSEALARELQDFVKRTIAPYKYPRAVEFAAALPRTETGKLQRFRLRQAG